LSVRSSQEVLRMTPPDIYRQRRERLSRESTAAAQFLAGRRVGRQKNSQRKFGRSFGAKNEEEEEEEEEEGQGPEKHVRRRARQVQHLRRIP
jgi:hypothetical protein